MSRWIVMIAVAGTAATAIWAWRAHEEVQRLDASLGVATQRIDQLQTSLTKARQGLDETRAELNRALDAAEQASQVQQPVVAQPVPPPIPQLQPMPTSPMEMAQLQASQGQDSPLGSPDAVLELKGRH